MKPKNTVNRLVHHIYGKRLKQNVNRDSDILLSFSMRSFYKQKRRADNIHNAEAVRCTINMLYTIGMLDDSKITEAEFRKMLAKI